MTEKGYNGWASWATWCLNLWFEESLRSAVEAGSDTKLELSDYMSDLVGDSCPNPDNGFLSDVINRFWSGVDWWELIGHYKAESDDESEDDSDDDTSEE